MATRKRRTSQIHESRPSILQRKNKGFLGMYALFGRKNFFLLTLINFSIAISQVGRDMLNII